MGTVKDFRRLEDAFAAGRLGDAREAASNLLSNAKKVTEQAKADSGDNDARDPAEDDEEMLFDPAAYDVATNVVVVVWAGKDGSGPTVLRRLSLPEPTSHPYSLDLPGLGGSTPPLLYEVLLAPDVRARLVSQYTFTREEDPIAAQIPIVAERLIAPIFGLVSGVGGPIRISVAGTAPAEEPIFATASRVAVPFPRAKVTVASVANIPVTPRKWATDAKSLATTLRFQTVPRSAWGKEYADRLADAAIAVAGQAECLALQPADACVRSFAAAFDVAYQKCMKDCVQGETPATDDVAAMNAVDAKFREFIATGGPVRIERTAEIKNRPQTRASLGIGTAVVASGKLSRDRAKLNDAGNLVADPLSRQMTMILLNWSPAGYDADAPTPQRAERWRLFLSGMLTPDPGLGIGGSMLVVRGLAMTAGYGFLFSRGLSDGDEFGKPPKQSTDPLDLARARVFFVGVSYNFK